jgi:hypothetical protein
MDLGRVEVDMGPRPSYLQREGLFSLQALPIVQGVMDQNPVRIRDKALFDGLPAPVHHGKFPNRGLHLGFPQRGNLRFEIFKFHCG